jgi:uridine phosphorylase
MQKEETPSGVLVGGTDSGHVVVWNPVKILNGETEDAVLFQTDKHTGAYRFLLLCLVLNHPVALAFKSNCQKTL